MSPLRRADAVGILFLIAVSACLFGFVDEATALTRAHPHLAGFAKFAVLATYGECLKSRLSGGGWLQPRLLSRAVIWGLVGVWIGDDFVLVDAGVHALADRGLTPGVFMPFWLSLWANLLSGFAFTMMFTHRWFDHMLDEGFVWPWEILGGPDAARWGKVVMIAMIVFWIPAHTLTFSLEPDLRVVCAAYLSIALGMILSFASRAGGSLAGGPAELLLERN